MLERQKGREERERLREREERESESKGEREIEREIEGEREKKKKRRKVRDILHDGTNKFVNCFEWSGRLLWSTKFDRLAGGQEFDSDDYN